MSRLTLSSIIVPIVVLFGLTLAVLCVRGIGRMVERDLARGDQRLHTTHAAWTKLHPTEGAALTYDEWLAAYQAGLLTSRR